MIRTLVAEHVHLVRIGLAAFLANAPDIDVVSELDRDDRLLAIASQVAPSVVIVDVDLPSMGGPAVVRRLRSALPQCACVLLVEPGDAQGLDRALSVRPLGVLSTDAPAELVARCVRGAAAGKCVLDPELAGTARTISENPLTPREREVLRMAAGGATTAEMADRLSVTAKTVRNHLSRIALRIGARNRVDAIRIAGESEWI